MRDRVSCDPRAMAVLAVACLAATLAGCEFPTEPPPRPEETPSPIAATLQASNAEAADLYRVVETYFNEYLALNPIFATELGDHRFDDRFGDYASASWMANSLGIEQEALERLASVDPARLRGEDRVSYAAFKRQRELAVYGFRYPSELLAINQFDNWANVFAQLASGTGAHPFRTTGDYDRFLVRMDGFVAWSEQVINNLRAGVSKGVVLPKVVVERTLPQLEVFARIEDPRQSIFWQPLLNLPPGPSVADRRRLIEAYDEKLRTKVIPEFRRLHDYLAQEYLPHARDSIGWSGLPSGDLWYAYLVRYHTTTDLTPGQVHELGLREVARLTANLAILQPALGVDGEPRAVFDAMRAEPKYRFADAAALLAAYEGLRVRVEQNLASQFLRAPNATFVIRAVEPYRAAAAAAASYQGPSADGSRPAVFYVNTSNLSSRPSYLMEPTFVHEAVPGHHYQVAIAQETPNLPSFRRFGSNTAYDEGWALYAESLGPQLGLYADPYAQFGALTMELWRAARLVVDTGIHAKGWSRQRAVDYLRANTALGDADVQAEVDRYIAWPGQALAYKVGQLKILELRREAERRLGARFDVREFHEQVVGSGSLPLTVLESKIDHWLSSHD
ncbi:MAG TPA: DUF885 domain-containing protein [Steroidobacteraceae bacterium]|nr:DUF885 domain-containing protein [Steroidobacteraceae bacterium]